VLAPLLVLAAVIMPPVEPGLASRQPQLAANSRQAWLTFGAGNHVYVSHSANSGRSWSPSVRLPSTGVLSLGMRRGPRIAATSRAVLVSAILGPQGRGADGDILLWRTTNQGRSWSAPIPVNTPSGSAREGLHAMAASPEGLIAIVWLDLRQKGTRLYGVFSRDHGQSWSPNQLLYESPSGAICQCCHPSVAVSGRSTITILFRNSLDGNRDMYFSTSRDAGSWLLNACPMDGGSLALGSDLTPLTVWRRENQVFFARPDQPEQLLGPGRQPVIASLAAGPVIAWTEVSSIRILRPGQTQPETLSFPGTFLSLLPTPSGRLLLAAEHEGRIFMELL
jgi:hypothetical protein